jgi:hypothetical protein
MILRDWLQPNREESEETVENPFPKWIHLACKREFSQKNA